MIDKILSLPLFNEHPPILMDLGASGEIHKKWRRIAKYSYCIAFDADIRKFGYSLQKSSDFKKLFTFHCIVSNEDVDNTDFYLTSSPYCSSTLPPDNQKLQQWAFAEKFEVVKKTSLKSITINKALQELNLDYIDWFKTDTQGTDLRLYNSMADEVRDKVLVAEFEPGIIDAYQGEDKLIKIMSQLPEQDKFWLSGIITKGTPRIQLRHFKTLSPLHKKLLPYTNKISPCWSEVTYMRSLDPSFSQRQLLLLLTFALIEKQYGFAWEIAEEGLKSYSHPLFEEARSYSIKHIKSSVTDFPKAVIKYLTLKYFNA